MPLHPRTGRNTVCNSNIPYNKKKTVTLGVSFNATAQYKDVSVI